MKRKTLLIFAGCFFSLLLLNADNLFAPPFWDDIIGIHTQAVWLARNSFDMAALLRIPPGPGNPCYNLLNPLSYLYACCYRSMPPDLTHLTAHLVNIVSAAVCVTLLFSLMRSGTAVEKILLALCALSTPLIVSACAGTGQELPLAVIIFLSIYFRMKGRGKAAWLLAFAGCCFKLTAATLVFAYAADSLFRQFRRGKLSPYRITVIAGGCLVCTAAYFWHFSHLDSHFKWKPAETISLFYNAYYLLFPLAVISVFLLAVRKRWLKPLPVIFYLILYFICNALSAMTSLPRYGVIIVFPVFYLLYTAARKCRRSVQISAFAVMIVFNLCCMYGRLLPPPGIHEKHDGSFMERSLEFTVMRQADREFCAFMEKEFFNRPVICTWPMLQMLTVPEFGYVSKALEQVYAGEYWHYLGNVRKADRDFLRKDPVFVYTPDCYNWRIPPGAQIIYASDPQTPQAGYMLYRVPLPSFSNSRSMR